MECKICTTRMRRLKREGFMQLKFFPIFGYYPWECPNCRKLKMERKQYQKKRTKVRVHEHERGLETLTVDTRTT
jgi:hypothetical protein